VQGHAEADVLRPRGDGADHRQRVGRGGEFLEEVMLDDGVDIEADLVGVLHLPHDLAVQLGMRLARRRLQLGVEPEA
jgi:hypothetical protein